MFLTDNVTSVQPWWQWDMQINNDMLLKEHTYRNWSGRKSDQAPVHIVEKTM